MTSTIFMEYLPGIIVTTFFISFALFIYRLIQWGIKSYMEGWWSMDSVLSTKRVFRSGFTVALLLSVMVFLSPTGDSDKFLILACWSVIMMFGLFYHVQKESFEDQKLTI